jgi:hypothetical protein
VSWEILTPPASNFASEEILLLYMTSAFANLLVDILLLFEIITYLTYSIFYSHYEFKFNVWGFGVLGAYKAAKGGV